MVTEANPVTKAHPDGTAGLVPLLSWLRTGRLPAERLDFPHGAAFPDGRLDMCKQDIGARGAAMVAAALRPGSARHLLMGTNALGDDGATELAASAGAIGAHTLYLGCNAITTTGMCRMANAIRDAPQSVSAVWLKRNPLGGRGGQDTADLITATRALRTLDLAQTGLDAADMSTVAAALLDTARRRETMEQLHLSGNPLGPGGAVPVADLLAAGAVRMLSLAATGLGDAGADVITDALRRAPYGRLSRLSVASNGIGPAAGARLVVAAAEAGVTVCDMGRIKAATALNAADNRLDMDAVAAIGRGLSAQPHEMTHLVLSHTGLRSREAITLHRHAAHAVTPTRYALGGGVARTVKRRLAALCPDMAPIPPVPPEVAVIRSVFR